MKKLRLPLILAIIGIAMCSFSSCCNSKSNPQEKTSEELLRAEAEEEGLLLPIEEGIEKIIRDLNVTGLGAAVVKDGQIIYANSWGMRDVEKGEELENDDLFRIASISKQFTATSIMQLVEKGKIDLNGDVSDLVGFKVRNPKYPDVKITPYMLLSHTSSLNDSEGYFRLDVINPDKNPNWANAYNNYRPGSNYEYCNLGFNTLGTILERVSNVRFDQYVVKNILEPLGVYGGYWIASLDSTKFVTLYTPDEEGRMVPQPEAYAPRTEEIANYEFGYSTPIFSPTGGMKLSPSGLAKVMIMHMGLGTSGNVQIIKPESALLMQSGLTKVDYGPDFPGDTQIYYGFALENTDNLIHGETMIGHTGGAYGVYTTMFFNKERTFGIVTMCSGCKGEREHEFMSVSYRVQNLLYNNLIKEKTGAGENI